MSERIDSGFSAGSGAAGSKSDGSGTAGSGAAANTTDPASAQNVVNPAPAPLPRTKRQHRRVVRKGTEWFDADGVKLEPADERTRAQRDADDDQRILGELPPHWAVFNDKR